MKRNVRASAVFLRRSPELAEPEDLRRFQLHMAAEGASPSLASKLFRTFAFALRHCHHSDFVY